MQFDVGRVRSLQPAVTVVAIGERDAVCLVSRTIINHTELFTGMLPDTIAHISHRWREFLDTHWSLPWLVVPSTAMALAIVSLFLLLGYSFGSTSGVVAVFLGFCAVVVAASLGVEWVAKRMVDDG